MTDDAKNWLIDGLKGTSFLAVLAAAVSIAWMLAEMNGKINNIQQSQEASKNMNLGTRITSLELKVEGVSKDLGGLERSIEKDINRLVKRVDKMDKP